MTLSSLGMRGSGTRLGMASRLSRPSRLRWGVLICALLCGCGSESPQGRSSSTVPTAAGAGGGGASEVSAAAPASAGGTTEPGSRSAAEPAPGATASAAPEAPEAPATPPVLRVGDVPRHAPWTAERRARLEALRASHPDRAEDVFSKMGGSSVVNLGFLHCFGQDQHDLGEHEALGPTLERFRAARVGRDSPFTRESLGAGVGWSIRNGMLGRPSQVVRELRASNARIALAFFGSNDVEGRNAGLWGERLDRLVSTILAEGALPILGSIPPRRRNAREMRRHVTEYNRVAHALAAARGLPFIDFYQTFVDLPRQGIRDDGVHPNVYRPGRFGRGCVLTEDGLRYGQNQRNLLVLEALAQIPAPGEAPEGDDVAESPRPPGEWIAEAPYGARVALDARPTDTLGPTCDTHAEREPALERWVHVDAQTTLRADVYGFAGAVGFLSLHDESGGCVDAAERGLDLELAPGTYRLRAHASRRRGPRARVPGDPALLLSVVSR